MDDLCERTGRFCAHLQRRRIPPHEFREVRLDGSIAQTQRIIGGVRNLRRILHMIKPVVLGDFSCKPRKFCCGVGLGQFFDGSDGLGHGMRIRWLGGALH